MVVKPIYLTHSVGSVVFVISGLDGVSSVSGFSVN